MEITMIKRVLLFLLPALLGFFYLSCFNFNIQNNIDYPGTAFYTQLELIDNLNQNRPASNLSLMFYEGEERRQLVKLSIPLSMLVTAGEEEIISFEKYSRNYLNSLEVSDLRKIIKMGRGLILEVKDQNENNHLLLWME